MGITPLQSCFPGYTLQSGSVMSNVVQQFNYPSSLRDSRGKGLKNKLNTKYRASPMITRSGYKIRPVNTVILKLGWQIIFGLGWQIKIKLLMNK